MDVMFILIVIRDHLQVYETLSSLRHEVGDARLTARTQRLLMLETLPEVQAFIDSQSAFNGDVAREAVALALSLPSTQWI